jgi:alcohol dehydrogenase class IV
MLSGTKWILNYNEVEPNPTIEFAERKLQEVKEAGPTHLVSIGGGSTIDTGKYTTLKSHIRQFPRRLELEVR